MNKIVFLYKESNKDDRDCVKYIDIDRLGKLECGHYFPSINLTGACFSMGLKLDDIDFNNITTILTKDEFIALESYNKNINDLGYGISKNDERYKIGIKYYKQILPILNKLNSQDNTTLFDKIIEEEKDYCMSEYNLCQNDIDEIFNYYNLYYQDRGIISYVYDDIKDVGKMYIENCGDIPEYLENYIDYGKFGEDLIDYDEYFQLYDGRIISLNY